MFGSDGSPIIQYVVIFAIIFTALAAIVFVVRRLTGGGLALSGRAGGRGRQPRLGIVDVYELDRARQLILLRRDNVEHLLLVGGPNDVVVERNIQRGQRPMPEATLRPETAAEPLPDPLAGAGRLPEPPRALPELRPEPAFEMPVVVAPPVPRSDAAPPVRLPLDAGLIGGDEPGQDIPAPTPAREPFSPGRLLRRAAPSLAERRSDPVPERPAGAAEAAPSPAPVPAPVSPPLAALRAERRTVDPAILSDMARQLQAAIARPASAVTPPPETAAGDGEGAEGRVDPVAAAMAAPPPAPEPVAPAPTPAPAPALPKVAPASAPASRAPAVSQPAAPATAERTAPPPSPVPTSISPASTPAPPPSMPVPPAVPQRPAEETRVEAPARLPLSPPPAAPEPKATGNPFSVEEIEAEFARLLGRPIDKRG